MSKHRPTTTDPYTTDQPKKKRSKWLTIGVPTAVVIGIVAVTTNGDKGDDTPTADAPSVVAESPAPGQPTDPATGAPAATDGDTLTFTAETSDGSTVDVTYLGADGQITQNQGMASPWSVDIDGLDGKWDAIGANMNAQQQGTGEVTCRVLWNGEEVATNTSSGPYSVVSCSLPM